MLDQKPISRDYGRRDYVESNPKSFVAEKKRVTDFQKFNNELEKHSEFKKPYLVDDYPEMEYWYMPPADWNLDFTFADFGVPLTDYIVTSTEEEESGIVSSCRYCIITCYDKIVNHSRPF